MPFLSSLCIILWVLQHGACYIVTETMLLCLEVRPGPWSQHPDVLFASCGFDSVLQGPGSSLCHFLHHMKEDSAKLAMHGRRLKSQWMGSTDHISQWPPVSTCVLPEPLEEATESWGSQGATRRHAGQNQSYLQRGAVRRRCPA